MVLDFIVLVLNAWKLAVPGNFKGCPNESAAFGESKSKLMTLIFVDGLVYFIVAFAVNLVATVRRAVGHGVGLASLTSSLNRCSYYLI
jgi:hypothetical protein